MDPKALFRHRRAPGIATVILFVVMALIGSLAVDDYGITWDEVIQRQHGLVTWDYLNELSGEAFYDKPITGVDLETYEHAHYGVLFPASVTTIDIAFKLHDFRTIFLIRRMCTFAIFLIALFFCRQITVYLTGSRWMGLLACLMLVLSPRIFAHSHFNSKDIILMGGYTVAAFTMIRYLDRPVLKWALIHGIVCGIAINTRILGSAIPAMTLVWFVLDRLFLQRGQMPLKQALLSILLFLASCLLTTIALWPYLWMDPYHHFIEVFDKLAAFQWGNQMLFMGEGVYAYDLPWTYLPVWIAISTPLSYLLLFAIGLFYAFRPLIANIRRGRLYRNKAERSLLLVAGLSLGPLILIIAMGSSVYNGWRHLYFIYPAMIVLATYGLHRAWTGWRPRLLRYALAALLGLQMLYTLGWMVRHHPLQAMYFNILETEGLEDRYEIDYWGSSLMALYQKVLERSDQELILFTQAEWNNPVKYTWNFLPDADKRRIRQAGPGEQADYYLTMYSWGDYVGARRGQYPFDQPAIVITVGDLRVAGAHQLK